MKKTLMGPYSNSLIRKTKAVMQAEQKEELIACFPSAGRCPATLWEVGPQHV